MANDTTDNLNVSAPLNATAIEGPNWTFTPSFTLFIQLSAFLNNGAMLLVFILNPTLVTPFTIYILNLFASNFIVSIFFYTIELINELYTTWWLGFGLCSMYQYTNWVLTGSMCIAHGAIALNRFWAVTFPLSYRHYHKKKFASAVIAAMWVVLHMMVVPGLVLDAIWYRLPMETSGCNVATDAPKEWLQFGQLVIMDAPVVIVALVYPVICYKSIQRIRGQIGSAGGTSTKKSTQQSPNATAPSDVSASVKNNTDASVSDRTGGEAQAAGRQVLCCKLTPRGKGHGFLAVTMMTSTVLLCYYPANVYCTLLIFSNIDVPGVFAKLMVLYELAAVLDPIWFMLSLSDLRNAFRRTFFPFC